MAKPKINLEEFKAYIISQCNIGIYVWGANGELLCNITPEWIARHEEDKNKRNQALTLYYQRKDIQGARAQDCSGYAMGFLMPKGWSDTTANGLKACCTPCTRAELRDGDFVFKSYKTGSNKGKAYHIGYYLNGKIYSAKGRKWGCVDTETGWTDCGHFNYYTEAPKPVASYPIKRAIKKGCKGEDVKAVQRALNTFGYCLAEDGSCGAKTVNAIKMYQESQWITIDGSAGKNTITSLNKTTGKVYWAK